MGILALFGKKNAQDREFSPETIVGKKCVVIDRIDTFAGCGQVKVNGQIWSARAMEPDRIFDEGEVVTVIAIEGVKLICK
jgi:membrane protein implicated in regulation of membrane protease activity